LTMTIRPATEADNEQWVVVQNSVGHQKTTVAEIEHHVKMRRPDLPWVDYIAEVNSRVVGITYCGAGSWLKPGDMVQSVAVLPEFRGQGIGTALYDYVQPFIKEHQPKRLRARVQDDMDESLAWAMKRGFENRHHIFDSTLNVQAFDPSPFAASLARTAAESIRMVHYNTMRTLDNDRRLHELYDVTYMDVPDAADRTTQAFDEWAMWFFESPDTWPEGCIVAVNQGGEWLGLTAMKHHPGATEAHIVMTGVRRESRGRGVAMALKLAATEFLRHEGFESVVTNNHSLNGPMLAINRKMGYVPMPGTYLLVKPM
jgi:ribosomal protein S18 acetylase RimI-like enzyme